MGVILLEKSWKNEHGATKQIHDPQASGDAKGGDQGKLPREGGVTSQPASLMSRATVISGRRIARLALRKSTPVRCRHSAKHCVSAAPPIRTERTAVRTTCPRMTGTQYVLAKPMLSTTPADKGSRAWAGGCGCAVSYD